MISESAFDDIQALLPAESGLSSAAPTPSPHAQGLATPSSTTNNRASSPAPAPPTAALAGLSVSASSPGPPSYSQSTVGGGAPPPPLPGRKQPPPPPPERTAVARARALYRYAASDARDCSFERDDPIEVHEYMNADWWMGRNARTGAEGIFPKNYVEIVPDAPSEKAGAAWNNNSAAYPGAGGYGASYQPPPQPTYGGGWGQGYQPPPAQVNNPYNSPAPPMAVANEPQQAHGESKFAGAGKKFGKKLGNAAIFGAGATLGGDLVNSIL